MKIEEIKDLMKFFAQLSINKLKIKNGDFHIELDKGLKEKEEPVIQATPAVVPQVQPIEIVTTQKELKKNTIDSPMVGTFYVAPSPGASPFVRVGDTVKKGDIIGIIEAMKIMNEIEAEFNCKIIESMVDDGQPVEFGMPLFAVEKI